MSPLRHYGGFVLAGGTALLVDMGILSGLTRGLGLGPLVARAIAIAFAMPVTWWINRTVTFAVKSPPTLAEYLKFAVAALAGVAVNYAVYAGLVELRTGLPPEAIVPIATLCAMVVSYTGYRFGVFTER